MAITKLGLGSGSVTSWYKRNGFTTIDADPASGADIIAEVPPLPDLGPLEYVEAVHFWEHLYLWQAEELARQIYAALKPDGKLVLELPDLWKCCAFVCGHLDVPTIESKPDERFLEWGIFGAQSDPKWTGNIWQVHKWGYTPRTLSEQLVQAGFRNVTNKAPTWGQPERDMRVEAVK